MRLLAGGTPSPATPMHRLIATALFRKGPDDGLGGPSEATQIDGTASTATGRYRFRGSLSVIAPPVGRASSISGVSEASRLRAEKRRSSRRSPVQGATFGIQIVVYYSRRLSQALIGVGLLDELRLMVYRWCSARELACSARRRTGSRCAWSNRGRSGKAW